LDGDASRNPGPASIEGVIYDPKGRLIDLSEEFIGHKTNAEAEYFAIIRGLKFA